MKGALHCMPCVQLLEHGADVHSHTANISQTPLRLAVDDVNLNSKMVELLVAYGASPFLEARDGMINNSLACVAHHSELLRFCHNSSLPHCPLSKTSCICLPSALESVSIGCLTLQTVSCAHNEPYL